MILASAAVPVMIYSSLPLTAEMRGQWLCVSYLLVPVWGVWLLVWSFIRLPLLRQELRLAQRCADMDSVSEAQRRRVEAWSRTWRALRIWAVTPAVLAFLALGDGRGWFSGLRFAWNRATLEQQAREILASGQERRPVRHDARFPGYSYKVTLVSGMAVFEVDGCEDRLRGSDWSSGGLVFAPKGLVEQESWRAESLEEQWWLWRGLVWTILETPFEDGR